VTSSTSCSFLFVPGNRPDRFDKARRSGARRIILDLEDAVEPEEKDEARDHIARWEGLSNAIVRINGLGSPWFGPDVQMVRAQAVATVMLPNAEPDAIQILTRDLGRRCSVIAPVETAAGYLKVRNIIENSIVAQLAFGHLDFGMDTGVVETDRELDPVRLGLVLESRRVGLTAPIDGVTPDWSSVEAFAQAVRRARSMGFSGKLCIHPNQVNRSMRGSYPARRKLLGLSG
jgi:citrate lyase subunit beta / citryl-CoA lyase